MTSIQVRKIQRNEERDIVTGMIVSDEFISRIRPNYNSEYFSTNFTKEVAEWCVEYYDQYGSSPGNNIQSIFKYKKEYLEEERAKTIETFLDSISEKYSENGNYNVEYHLDNATKYFKSASLDILIEQIQSCKLAEDYEEAERAVANFKRIEKHVTSGIDVVRDTDAILRSIRDMDDEGFFKFPGELGEMIGQIEREDFFAIFGPAKRGKTVYLQEFGILALFQGLNVVFYSLEMSEKQMLTRIHQRLNSMTTLKGVERIAIPEFDSNYDINGVINQRFLEKEPLSVGKAVRKTRKIEQMIRGKNFHLMCYPSNSINVKNIETQLDTLEYYDGITPDVVIVDYADILAPERKNEHRHRINDTWEALRSLAQKRKCIVVTGSHSNKATFERNIRQGDASEDSRKMNHVTHAIGLNQTDAEKELGLMRINILASRFKAFNVGTEIAVLQCPTIGRPYLDSRKFKKSVEND